MPPLHEEYRIARLKGLAVIVWGETILQLTGTGHIEILTSVAEFRHKILCFVLSSVRISDIAPLLFNISTKAQSK